VGEGRESPEWAAEGMASRERVTGFAVAPAHGLTLEEVGYPADDQLAAQAVDARNRRTLGDEDADR
jgi:tRNA pseudouridine38-40 synthase